MLYVFFGKDSVGVREKALAFIQTRVSATNEVVKITEDGYAPGILTELAESVSLFGGDQVILIDTPSKDTGFYEGVKKNLEALAESQNLFVVIEQGLLAPEKKIFSKHAEGIEEVVSETVEKFNVFALTDAFTRRDKKALWMLLMDAWKEGVSNEEIVGILFWQIKVLRLVEHTHTPEEAGQKPFVYNKAKQALRSFKKGELDALSRSLVLLYHEGHGGKADMSVALERWVLTL
jgi:DNA polymerase III delta subunit